MENEIETDSDDVEQEVEQAVQQAQQYHAIMDEAKLWSRETATDIRVKAEVEEDEESASRLNEIAALIETVGGRVEQGDNSRARRP